MEFGRSYQNIILGVHLNVIYHLLDCIKKYLYLWYFFHSVYMRMCNITMYVCQSMITSKLTGSESVLGGGGNNFIPGIMLTKGADWGSG